MEDTLRDLKQPVLLLEVVGQGLPSRGLEPAAGGLLSALEPLS